MPPRESEPKLPKLRPAHVYSHEQIVKSIGTIRESRKKATKIDELTFRTLLLLLYGTGMRIGEALRLTMADVDLNEAAVTVRKTKFNKSQIVPLGAQLCETLRSYAEQRMRRNLPEQVESSYLADLDGISLRYGTAESAFERSGRCVMPEKCANLAGRVALVTGGARGIGLAIAKSLIEDDARVTIVDTGSEIDGSNPDATVVETAAENLGKNAAGCSLDIGSAESAQQAVRNTIERWGRLDIVINNAAILRDHFIFKARPNDFEEVVRVNLAGYYYVLAAASPVFREQAKAGSHGESYHWGRVVNIVSTAGFYGNYGQSSYASAKNGVVGLTRVAALDLARSKIMVNAVAPFARSRVTEIIVPANEEQAVYKERALKIKPNNVATVVSWLCSDSGEGITGQMFGVRGREVFLFSQPRPVRKFILDSGNPDSESIRRQADEHFDGAYTELETDLESFNSEPVI